MRTLPGKIKTYILPWFIKRSSVQLTATLSNLNKFQSFLHCRNRKKCTKGYAFTYLSLKENIADDVINVSLFAGPVVCGGIVCWPVSTLKADILNITYDCYSQNNNVKMAAQ